MGLEALFKVAASHAGRAPPGRESALQLCLGLPLKYRPSERTADCGVFIDDGHFVGLIQLEVYPRGQLDGAESRILSKKGLLLLCCQLFDREFRTFPV